MDTKAESIRAFWEAFQRIASQARSFDTDAYEAALASLHRVDPALFLEFSTDELPHELIVTAEGNRRLFPLVKMIVASAPSLVDWTFLPLKPKLGFPETVRWERVTIRPEELVFEPLERPESDELGLRVFVPKLRRRDIEDAHSAVLCALDHGLGEEEHALAIAHVEVLPLPAGTRLDQLIPLVQLEQYVAWRRNQSRPTVSSRPS